MTIDSRYFQQVLPAREGTVYPVELEFGPKGSLFFYRKQADGTLIPLTNVAVVFEEDLRPIKRRGRVTLLDGPIPLDEELLIVRETLIEHEYTAVDGEPFAAKEFEYVADRATLILQELEGNICMCKEPDWGGPDGPGGTPPVDPPPTIVECQPYACDAVRNHHLEVYDNVWYAETATGNELDQAKGDMRLFGDFGPALYFDPDPVYPDGCYTSIRRVGIGGGNAIRGLFREWGLGESIVTSGVISMAISCRDINDNGAAGSYGFMKNELNFVRTPSNVVSGGATMGLESRGSSTIGLTIGGYSNPTLGSNSTELFVPWADLDAGPEDANIFHLDCEWAMTGSPGNYVFTATITAYLNGIFIGTITRPSETLTFGGSAVRVDREFIRFFHGNNTIGRINNVGVNLDSLVAPDGDAVARARNFADYQPPAYCDELVLSPG